jgi:hypothetical protein
MTQAAQRKRSLHELTNVKQIMSVMKWPSLLSVLGTLQRTVCALEFPILTALDQNKKIHETPTIPGVYELPACSFPLAFASSKGSAKAHPGLHRLERRISSGCWQLALLKVCSRGSNVSLLRTYCWRSAKNRERNVRFVHCATQISRSRIVNTTIYVQQKLNNSEDRYSCVSLCTGSLG